MSRAQPLRRSQGQLPEIRRERGHEENRRLQQQQLPAPPRQERGTRLLPLPAGWKRSHVQADKENSCPNAAAAEAADCQQPLEACVLCGCILTPDMYKRFKSLDKLSATLRKGCVRTPYVYEHIVNMAAAKPSSNSPRSRVVPFCVACVNWIHRLEVAVAAAPWASAQPSAVFVGVCSCEEEDVQAVSDDEDFLGLWDISSEDEGGAPNQGCPSDGENPSSDDEGAAAAAASVAQQQGNPGSDDEGGSGAPAAALDITDLSGIPDLQRMDRLVLIPLDNLLLFLSDPGGTSGGAMQPDRRSMFRLMCALCATQTTGKHHTVRNPYRMFCTPVTDRILRMFERDYAHKFTGSNSLRKGRRRLCVESTTSEESIAMLNDIVRCWWETVGMPPVLAHSANAKLVRKALRLEE